MIRAFALAAATAGLVLSTPATACSFSWSPGYSPDEIKERANVRRVKGRFVAQDMTGSADENGELYEGKIFGRLETLRGTGWDTWQEFHRISLDCGAYLKPLADAQGTFWISRRKKDGRYQILLWEGEYLPATDDVNEAESEAN
ncbi:MAG: hypothetical protein ABJP70_11460 [Erythrobacter sp.]